MRRSSPLKNMSVAARSVVEKTSPRSPKLNRKSQKSFKNTANKVIKRDSSFKSPLWLRSLLVIQRSSGAIAFGTIAIIFIIYSSIVYTQQKWGKEYKKLKTLQRQERILIQTNESLKNDLANLAEKSQTDLVPIDPQRSIFLNPTSIELTQQRTEKIEIQSLRNIPSGY